MGEPELTLKRISASALSDICKHSPELAQTVVDAGAVSLLAKDISHIDAPLKRQVCSCLSQIAKHSVDLAEVVVEAEIFPRILHCLKDVDDHVRKNAATCIREIARHTPDLARALAESDVLRRLLAVYLHQDSSEDLKTKAKRALKSVIQKCTHLPALEPLLQEAPPNILKYVVQQFAHVLPNDLNARRSFVQSGGLQKIQEV